MPDLTFDLPDEVHQRLCKIAEAGKIEPELLAHQIISLKVGYNSSSKDTPISTILLERLTDEVLHLAETEPVHLNDPEHGGFVIVAFDEYEKLSVSDRPPEPKP